MQRLHHDQPIPEALRGAVLALGNFDGFHLGHQAVVSRAIALGFHMRRPVIVATFDPHPVRYFKPDVPPFRLTTLDQRQELFAHAGADAMLVFEFGPDLAATSAEEFVTEILAGRGLSAASVAISPAPFRGVLPLPISSLRAASPALRNPLNRNRAVPLTYDQFRYAFANAVDEDQAQRLYEQYSVPTPGEPLFQAAAANLNPWTEAKVDTKNPDRGPMLIVAGGKDHTVPVVISKASFKQEEENPAVTEFQQFDDRGHALTIDDNWQEVAETALKFVGRFAS